MLKSTLATIVRVLFKENDMEKMRTRAAIAAAFCAGIVLTLVFTLFTGSARASRNNEYKTAKTAADVVRLGEMGYEYVGLGPGGQGIMKK